MASGISGLLAGFVGIAGGVIPSGGEIIASTEGAAPTLDTGDSLTVVSWNIHYGGGPTLARGRGQSRAEVVGYLDEIAELLRSLDADIVALQEVDRAAVRSFDIDQLRWLQEATGLAYAAWTPTWDAGWVPHPGLRPSKHIGRVQSGQVVLSRFPLSNDTHTRLPQPESNLAIYNRFYLHRHLTEVQVQLGPSTELQLVNAHLEAFDDANRRDHASIAAQRLASNTGLSLLLGDMNCTPPEAKLRRAFPDEPETDMSTDNTIALLRDIPRMSEVVPTKVYAADERSWFTFPAHKPNRRLDYIFHGERLKLISAEVPALENPPSDHLPIVARFEID
jgi:endonuclease/exonuclease/phosphatase family metal-dependent hydrolase